MAFLNVEDLFGSFEVILFPKTYEKFGKLISQDMIAVFRGKVNIREDDEPNIYCSTVSPIESFKTENDKGPGSREDRSFYVKQSKLGAVKAFCNFFTPGNNGGKTERISIFSVDDNGFRSETPVFNADIMFDREIRAELESIIN